MADPAYPIFVNTDATALEGGKIYIGVAYQDPETNPLDVFWDAALSVAAAQPLRTSGGIIVRDGAAANIYAASQTYSIRVRNSKNALVWNKAVTGGTLPATRLTFPIPTGPASTVPGPADNTYSSLSALLASDKSRKKANLVGDTDLPAAPDGPFNVVGGQWVRQGATGISYATRTVDARLGDVVSVIDKGAVGDATTQSQAAFTAAAASLTSGGGIDVPAGTYKVGQQFIAPSRGNVHVYDTAVIGTNELIGNKTFTGNPPTGWTLNGFTAANPGVSKAAGSTGSVSLNLTVAPYTLYVVEMTATTTAKGGLAFYLDGNPASNINDFPTHPVGSLTRKSYIFSYASTGSVLFEIRGEARWAGTINSISLIQVQREAPYDFFSIASDRKDFGNVFGIKFGRFLSGNMSMGDRTTQGLLSSAAAWNVAIGSRANASTIDAFENTAVGCFTLEFNQVDRNSAFGYSALRSNITGTQNTGLGYKAFVSNTTGFNNTGAGFHAGLYNRDGNNNTAIGTLAAYYNESGQFNVSIGSQAGINAGGDGNVYVGTLTGPIHSGEYRYTYANQTCVGTESSAYGNNTVSAGRLARCGSDPSGGGGYTITTTAVAVGTGSIAGQDSAVAVGGNANASMIRTVAVGEAAQATAANATALGFIAAAGEQSSSLGAQSGINCIGVGNTNVGYGANAFGSPTNRTNASAFGFGAATSGDNEVTLGNSAVGKLRCAVTTITAISDKRDKKAIKAIDSTFAVDIIRSLKPVRWDWNMRGNVQRDGGDVGFIAQDLVTVQDEHQADWLQLVNASDPKRLEATPGRLIPVLVAALQDALARIAVLEAK